MGRKNILKSYKMFDALSLASSATSDATDVTPVDKASIHIAWTGSSPVGSIAVWAQNGDDDSWYDLGFSAISISGASGSHQVIFNELPFTKIRLVYTRVSGTGSLNARISSKTVGA